MANLRRESLYLYTIQISNFAIPLLTLPHLTKVLGLSGLGKLGIMHTIFFFMGFLIDFGFTYSAAREISLAKGCQKKISKIYTNVQLLRLLIFLFISVILVIFICNLSINKEDRLIYVISILSSLSFVFIPNWLFNGLSKNSILAFFTLIFKILTLIPIFLLVQNSNEYLLAFIIQNSSLIVLSFVVSIYVLIGEKIKFSVVDIDFDYIKIILKESFNVFSGSALSIVYTTFVPFLIKISLGDKWVGVYVLVEKILSVLKQMFMPIIQVFYAKICVLYNEKKINEIKFIIRRIFVLYLLLTGTAILATLIFGQYLVKLFFDNQQILIKYIYISIVGQFVVGLSILTIYGGVLPSGNAFILKKIYLRACILYIFLVFVTWNFLTLDIVYFSVIFVEFIIVINAYLVVKKTNKLMGVNP